MHNAAQFFENSTATGKRRRACSPNANVTGLFYDLQGGDLTSNAPRAAGDKLALTPFAALRGDLFFFTTLTSSPLLCFIARFYHVAYSNRFYKFRDPNAKMDLVHQRLKGTLHVLCLICVKSDADSRRTVRLRRWGAKGCSAASSFPLSQFVPCVLLRDEKHE